MDIMYDLRTTNDALLSSKQNEIMQKLTVISFITFPLSVIAGVFGLSSNYVPLMDKPSGFYIVIGIMAIISITMYLTFKKKGWF
jgi:magnesium transporter